MEPNYKTVEQEDQDVQVQKIAQSSKTMEEVVCQKIRSNSTEDYIHNQLKAFEISITTQFKEFMREKIESLMNYNPDMTLPHIIRQFIKELRVIEINKHIRKFNQKCLIEQSKSTPPPIAPMIDSKYTDSNGSFDYVKFDEDYKKGCDWMKNEIGQEMGYLNDLFYYEIQENNQEEHKRLSEYTDCDKQLKEAIESKLGDKIDSEDFSAHRLVDFYNHWNAYKTDATSSE